MKKSEEGGEMSEERGGTKALSFERWRGREGTGSRNAMQEHNS